ncbi:nuclear pore complex protein Nup155 [Nilaparvata lugens]|uniref:nuclear pore complex protein Nup155 n=1 Tax=Nilaparvata lugens TaxID=108931 RepID=UPI00193CC6FE|nr:nuclear pore complex protein Nup155 [Nilaparvata lugens]
MAMNSSVVDRPLPVDPFRAQMESLELAGKMVEKFTAQDNNFPLLVDRMRVSVQQGPTYSGLSETDYPNTGNVSRMKYMKNLSVMNKVPLPPEILEHFSHLQCHCMMGIFPEINRAWLTIDSDIFIWNFEHGSDVAYYDGLSETIVSVGLVKPKPGVFMSYIKRLLVITTVVDIVVLGVTFKKVQDGGGETDELHLTPEIIYTLPVDGVSITTIVGTDNGRIFLGGKDGSVYEIIYQKELGWWGKRCKKVNHSTGLLSMLVPSFINAAFVEEDAVAQMCVDASRHVLYTLSERGVIEVFDLGACGTCTARVASLTQAGIVQAAINIVRTFDSSDFRPIVSISAIEACESAHMGLVAVTESGARLYLTTGAPGARPSTLQLMHVRLPPGFVANAPATRPSKVHKAIYTQGNLLLVTSPGGTCDKVWCLSGDAFPLQPALSEAQSTVTLDGQVWAAGEVCPLLPPPPTHSQPPLLVRQIYEPARRFVLLTPQGAEIVKKLRPVDMLVDLLTDSNGPDSELVKSYFSSQTEQQAAATCLILACNQSTKNAQIAEWATRAFFLYGGEPSIGAVQHHVSAMSSPNYTYSSLPPGFNPGIVSTPVKSAFSSPPDNTTVYYSAKHNGLYLHLSRILRPLWDTRIVQRVTMKDNNNYLESSVLGEEIAVVTSHLLALRSFLERNTQFASSCANMNASAFDSMTWGQRSRLQEAQLMEKSSLDALRMLVDHAAQVLGLWRVMCDHQFHVIADALPREQQEHMTVATFRDLILAGQELCDSLIDKLINTYLSDNTSVDTISRKLREICPKLYRNEDAACTKVNEMLLSAQSQQNRDERQKLLKAALKLCKEVAPRIHLKAVCRRFVACRFYEGILELCLECASKADPKNIALHFYQAGQPSDDQVGYQAFAQRMEIYKEVTSILDRLHHQSQAGPHSPSVPPTPGSPPPVSDFLPDCEAHQSAALLQNAALCSQDELLHVAIYDWMVQQRLFGDLIESGRPSLESYLKRCATDRSDDTDVCNLLWKFHERNGNHAAAAQILYSLAKQPGSPAVSLSERMTYLAKAVICMRSDDVGCAPHLGVFLHELEDLVQVARIQKRVLDAVSSLAAGGGHHEAAATEAVTRLNSALLTVTELYEEFAEPFQLWDCKLAIVDCSGHDDPDLINDIWTRIIQAELDKCASASGDDKMTVVLSKVKSLGQQYQLSSRTLPLEHVVWHLELAACRLHASRALVHQAMLVINVPFARLLHVYERLVALNDRCWLNEGGELYLIEVVASLARTFTSDPRCAGHGGERKKIAVRMQDLLTNCLSTLYSKPNTQELINQLKAVQTDLNRI